MTGWHTWSWLLVCGYAGLKNRMVLRCDGRQLWDRSVRVATRKFRHHLPLGKNQARAVLQSPWQQGCKTLRQMVEVSLKMVRCS